MSIIIRNLAIAGYRSFGKSPQYFDRFAKVNLLIGRNNAGKSNVIRFLSDVYPQPSDNHAVKSDELMNHLPDNPPLMIGVGEALLESNSGAPGLSLENPIIMRVDEDYSRDHISGVLGKVYKEKQRLDQTSLTWTLLSLPDRKDKSNSWRQSLNVLSDDELRTVWTSITKMTGGNRNSWEIAVAEQLSSQIELAKIVVIPAIRQIGLKNSTSDSFDGNGIIEKLARLQNPSVHNRADRQKFDDVTKFLQTVIDNPLATIEVPYDRDTILVHMDDKVLPVESLGSGIHEILILAAAATVLTGHVVCIEEPELHLNPILQRKLIRYLLEHTNNQYFLSTHSPALMDTPGVEIYHIKLENQKSVVERVTSDQQRSLICEDLGYHPSDLLQANSIIWVEGPSDRVYVKYWIKELAPDLIEGIHYSIMFYGGRLASHLTNEDNDNEVDDFIKLRRLNRRGVILIDSDRNKKGAPMNATKLRLKREFDQGPGHAWVTDGREIENYLPTVQISKAIATTHPKAKTLNMGKYDNCLNIKASNGREKQASKVKVARYIVANFRPDFNVLDLNTQIKRLIVFINSSNPQKNLVQPD